MNILVLTTRNIYEGTGEKTLMLAKDRFLKKENINLVYYSFRRKFESSNEQNFNIIKQQSMLDLIFNKNQIKENIEMMINKYETKIIVVSGNWILFLKKQLQSLKKQYGIKISYDYQGAIEEIKEYKLFKNNQFLSNILFLILQKYERSFIEIIDGIEAVSQNAIDNIKNIYAPKNTFSEVLIHCGIEKPISNEDYNIFREQWRNKYYLSDMDIACVYAGGIAKWQNIDEIIKQAKYNNKIKLYIYTSKKNQQYLKDNFTLSSNIYFDYLSHDELQKALCAFDYGYLLRNKDITNYVAFPNKFSDYINARLTVLVKNKEIGYYSKELEEKGIVQSVCNDLILKSKGTQPNSFYLQYINYLAYYNMIQNLKKYYIAFD